MTLICLSKEYTDASKARAVPGAWFDRETKGWVLKDPTPRAAAVALRMFPTLGVTNPELVELRASLGQQVRPFDNATPFGMRIEAPGVEAALAAEDHAMYDFQAIDLGYIHAVLEAHGGAYLGWERGLGKTLGAAALADAVSEIDFTQILVVAPNTAKRSVWLPELRRFLPDIEVVVLRNTKSQREKDLGYVRQLIQAEQPFAFVVHYEALNIIAGQRANNRGWDRFGEWDLIVADEAHRIANQKTLMAKALKRIPAKRKLALSGSIIQNHAEELFSPLQWLFPDHYRSRWRDWNDRYLDYVESGYSKVCVGVKIEKLEEMRNELGVFMVYRRKEDELDLPERTEQTLFVDLSPAQRKAYDSLIENYYAELPDGSFIKASDGLVLLTRLRQVATGLDLVSGELTDSTKQDLAVEMIQDNPDEAFVVFSWYKAAGRSLSDRLTALGIENYVVDGDVRHDVRAQYIQEFQAGRGRVFIGTLSTLGESVTLHRASNAIFLDRSWNPGTNVQAADRIYRIGQRNAVTITSIIARDTVDELRVQPAIQDKEALRALILGG
jgi:SNF2 family DNA or RNA helicase